LRCQQLQFAPRRLPRLLTRQPVSHFALQPSQGPGLFFAVLLAVVDIAEMRRLTVVTVAVAVRRPIALFDSKRLGRCQTSGAQRGKETPEYRGNDRPREPEHPQVR
jgi:hypothetical protein